MREYLVTAQIKVAHDGEDPYMIEMEFRITGVDNHAAGVAADDVVQAELEIFGGHGTLESLELEEL